VLLLTAAVADCLQRHVHPGEEVVVGLSGGMDSVVLMHVLAHAWQGRVAALHVNHGISSNACAWADFCEAYARNLQIPCTLKSVAVERGSPDGLEAAARRARHAVFAQTDSWIACAHHRDDQAETLLFNLLRGTGIAGAAAMRERNGRVLRPFLSIGRADIELYARAHHLEWIDDESNADVRHARNFLRHRILAPLRQRFPAAAKNLAGAAARFAEAEDLIDALARLDLGEYADFPVPADQLRALDEPRARNALRYLLARRGVQIPGEARLREALRQMLSAGADRHPRLTLGNVRLLRRRGLIHLEPAEDSN
jgi:tRNA(Ile)-lysidine synthase